VWDKTLQEHTIIGAAQFRIDKNCNLLNWLYTDRRAAAQEARATFPDSGHSVIAWLRAGNNVRNRHS
jgi:hypothetical protein